jgi:type I restriction enzyme, S subunit
MDTHKRNQLRASGATKAHAAIALLQERRSALISAAVTGKIDARGLAPATAEAA